MRRIFTLVAAAVMLAGTGISAIAGGHLSSEKSIVKNAAETDNLTTLVAAVKAAGLVEALEGDGPLTVFAPTDEAFAKLPEGTVENLLKPENKDQLVAILTYHVVPGKVMSSDLAGKQLSAETLEGSKVNIDASSGVKVDEATVVRRRYRSVERCHSRHRYGYHSG